MLPVGVAISQEKKEPPNEKEEPKSNMPKPLIVPFTEAEGKQARTAWARYLKAEETLSLDLGKEVKLELMLIPPGIFMMGSSKAEQDFIVNKVNAGKRPSLLDGEGYVELRLTRPYYMALRRGPGS